MEYLLQNLFWNAVLGSLQTTSMIRNIATLRQAQKVCYFRYPGLEGGDLPRQVKVPILVLVLHVTGWTYESNTAWFITQKSRAKGGMTDY
jgi:hypothetical protein